MFKINNEELYHYKIVPDFNIDNTSNEQLVKSLSFLYKPPRESISLLKKTYTTKRKCYFDIILIPHGAYFYISVSKEYSDLIKNKIQTIWPRAAVTRVNSKEFIDFDFEKSEIGGLVLKDYNFKSLSTSKENLYPLTTMLGITTDLAENKNEKVRISFIIEPTKRRNWVQVAKDEYKNYSKGKVIDKSQSNSEKVSKISWKIIEFAIMMYIEFRLLFIEAILGVFLPNKQEEEKPIEIKIDSIEALKEENKLNGLTSSTHYKMSSEVFNTSINIISQSDDKHRRHINLVSVANSYKDLNADNELVLKRLNRKEQEKTFKKCTYQKSAFYIAKSKNIFSDKEVSKFIQMPQKTLQQEYKLDNIDTREIEVPDDLQRPGIKIGTAEKKREKINTYWCNDYNSMALPKVIAGPQGAGKDKYTENFIKDANKLNHCTIVFDYIKSCELTKNVIEHTNNNVTIDLSNPKELFAFAYPEVSQKIDDNSTTWEKILVANDIAQQVKYLINAITDDSTGPLTAQMTRYLITAAKVVFIHPNEKLDNVFKVLEDWQTRGEYIRKTKGIYEYNDRVLNTLRELNDTNDDGKVIGTRYNLIQGIMNRIDRLLEDPRLELMLKSDVDNTHDFTKYMNEGNAVYIKMPENAFKDPVTKDIIVTYFMTRIRLASLERSEIDKPNIAHIVTNEVHQIPTAASFFKNHITEFRKFGLAPFFTIHYLKQFRSLLDAIKSSGVSYMLLAGLESENILALKDILDPFTLKDALELKPYHSLNIIRHNNQYARFISALPKPIQGGV